MRAYRCTGAWAGGGPDKNYVAQYPRGSRATYKLDPGADLAAHGRADYSII